MVTPNQIAQMTNRIFGILEAPEETDYYCSFEKTRPSR